MHEAVTSPRRPVSAASRWWAWSLVLLAFGSKLSLSFTGAMPSGLGYIVFQGGIHPYLNVLLNLILGAGLFFSLQKNREWPSLKNYHRLYVVFTIGTIIILWIQHLLQLVMGIESNWILAIITMCTCTFLITVFGFLIPQLIKPREFIVGVAKLCFVICFVSVVFDASHVVPSLWKGARFIGIFKHIPYMVTCATVGFLFTLEWWDETSPWKQKGLFAFKELVFLWAMWLTGTRSAPVAALLGLIVFFLAYRSKDRAFNMARVLVIWMAVVGTALFGYDAAEFAHDVATGKASVGKRAAQDGVSDRMEEVSRGLEMLNESPHVGLGLLSKFNNADSEDVVDSYNSFQDPHNLFISSSVVAGWPFGLWVLFGFGCLGVGSITLIRRREKPGLTIAIYLLGQMPILAIYHMHLSLGGPGRPVLLVNLWVSGAFVSVG